MRAGLYGIVVLAAGLAACAAQPEEQPLEEEIDPSVEETLVYLRTLNPPQVDSVRFREPLRYDVVNVRFVYMDTRDGRYLIEMARDCKPLKSNELFTDMADRRSMRGRIRAGIDTIRGCRIGAIYELPPARETRGAESGQTQSTDQAGPVDEPEQENR